MDPDCSSSREVNSDLKMGTGRPRKKYSKVDKSALIKELMLREQRRLKITKINASEELETNRISQKRNRIIREELLSERRKTFANQHFSMSPQPESSTTVSEFKTQVPFPSIRRHHLNRFLKMLSEEEKLNNSQKELKKCIGNLNSNMICHWTLPISLLRAVKDCILHRKWNNLTHLLLLLMKLPSYKYKPLIRHVSIHQDHKNIEFLSMSI